MELQPVPVLCRCTGACRKRYTLPYFEKEAVLKIVYLSYAFIVYGGFVIQQTVIFCDTVCFFNLFGGYDLLKFEVRDLACGYAAGKPVLEHVDITVNTGDICCLLGPNGVGKTTLFKTILGLQKPLSGTVLMDGQDISKWSVSRLAKNIAYVSQFHNPPFPYKVRDVVLLGRVSNTGYFGKISDLDYSIAERAMSDMGITHLRDKVYTDVSGGERQMVMIARALAQQPKLLVMDEPTANLDYGNMVRVVNKIRSLSNRGFAVILTTHSPDQAFMCDSTVALLKGKKEMVFGTAADVITEQNLYDAYGIDIKVIEYYDPVGRLVRMCTPVLE